MPLKRKRLYPYLIENDTDQSWGKIVLGRFGVSMMYRYSFVFVTGQKTYSYIHNFGFQALCVDFKILVGS